MRDGKEVSIDGIVYPSASEAARRLGVKKITLIKRLGNKNFPTYFSTNGSDQETLEQKYTLYEKEHKSKLIRTNHTSRPVLIDDICFPSIREASEKLNLSMSKIWSRIRNPKFIKYQWKNHQHQYLDIEGMTEDKIREHIISLINQGETNSKISNLKNEPNLWNWILSQNKNRIGEHTVKDLGKVFLALHPDIQIICPFGNTKVFQGFNDGFMCRKNCKCTQERRHQSFKRIYGVGSTLALTTTREKRKETMLKRWGVEYPSQNQTLLQKISQTTKEKFGSKNIANTQYFLDKSKTTSLSRYGVSNPKQRHIPQESLAILSDKETFSKLVPCNTINTLAKLLLVSEACIWATYYKFGLRNISFITNRSSLEEEIRMFLSDHKYTYKSNDRTQIKPFELDFYISAYNIAIEVQGTYWHMDPRKYTSGDFNVSHNLTAQEIWNKDMFKKKLCGEKGIKLITVWESDWNNSNEKTKKQLLLEIQECHTQ